jgi:hypothetical protein
MLDRRPLLTLLVAALLIAPAGPAFAEVYKYTDAQGGVHFTDNPSLVPDHYRSQLEKLDLRQQPDSGDSGGWFSGETPAALDRIQPGFPEFEKLQGQMEHWMRTWGALFIVAGLVWGVITLVSVFHAFANQRIVWGILNLFTYVSVPIYFLIHFDRYSMWARSLLVLGWGAPFVVAPFVLRAGISILPG